MILVRIQKTEGNISQIEVTGHAMTAEKGSDLVCAGVSSVMFGLCNAIEELDCGCEIQVQDNLVCIWTVHPTEKTQVVLQTGLIQLGTISESFPDAVKMIELED